MTVNRILYYVLREKATGHLMPLTKVHTRAEFGDLGVPRLFRTSGAAKQALDCWRMGHWRLTGDEDGCWPEPPDPAKHWNADVIAARKDVEVEIAPMKLLSMSAA